MDEYFMRGCGGKFKVFSIGHQIESEHELICGEGALCQDCKKKNKAKWVCETCDWEGEYYDVNRDCNGNEICPECSSEEVYHIGDLNES